MAIWELGHKFGMRARASLAPAAGATESDGPRELGPVEGIEMKLVGSDRHQRTLAERRNQVNPPCLPEPVAAAPVHQMDGRSSLQCQSRRTKIVLPTIS